MLFNFIKIIISFLSMYYNPFRFFRIFFVTRLLPFVSKVQKELLTNN